MLTGLKGVPQEERPRERLLREGVDALSLAELIAIVLGSGVQGKSVLSLAWEIVQHFGNLDKLLEASLSELMEIKGIGRVKAIQLKAIFGIALKCRIPNFDEKRPIQNAQEAYLFARGKIAPIPQEVLFVMLRDAKGCLIHSEKVASGTLSEVLAHPREVFYPAVKHKAFSFIIAHNHPSGDPTPSKSDLDLTRILIEAGRVLAILLDDHLIVCKERFVSLRQRGYFPHLAQMKY
jgi:DNA repair protein RadC